MLMFILFLLALPAIVSLLLVLVSFFVPKMTKERRGWWRLQVLLGFDQLVNTWFMGWADETISSRSYRVASYDIYWGKCMEALVNLIFFWEPDHCHRAYDNEMDRTHFPPEMRKRPTADPDHELSKVGPKKEEASE